MFVFVFDLLGIDAFNIVSMRASVAETLGVPVANVLFTCTHNHLGPPLHQVGDGADAMFIQGACGDLVPKEDELGMDAARLTGALQTLLNVKTRPTRGGFVENVVFRRIRADVVSNAMVHVSTRNAKWAHLEKGLERMPTRIDGITVEDVRARWAGRVIKVQGDPELPIRNLTVRKTSAEVADRPDAIENAGLDGDGTGGCVFDPVGDSG